MHIAYIKNNAKVIKKFEEQRKNARWLKYIHYPP